MTKRVETRPAIVQVGLANVVIANDKDKLGIIYIELCDLPRVIKQLQDIQEATNIDHVPDITGICRVCGNEVLSDEEESSL